MKTKLTKIWGIGLVVILLAMLIGAAIPVSAATLAWSPVSTPNPLTNQLQADTNVDALAIAPDGTTMFAYDDQAATDTLNGDIAKGATVTTITVTTDATAFKLGAVFVETEQFNVLSTSGVTLTVTSKVATAAHSGSVSVTSRGVLYKSTNAGATWTTTNIGGTLEGEAVLALAISPDYASDATVVVATSGVAGAAYVYRSINGGKTFGNVGALGLGAGESITSVAISPHYLGGTAILVGTSDGSGNGSVFKFTTSSLTWIDLTPDADLGLVLDVVAVAFSPNHKTDAEILAVVTTTNSTLLIAQFGTDNWGLGVETATVISSASAATAVIAFADDYEWSSNNRVLVGTTGSGVDDVFRVHGALPGGQSAAYDLNVNGTATPTEVYSIAVKGAIAEADVLVGQVASTTVKRAHDPTSSSITWRSSTKAPTGQANTLVIWSPTGIGDDAYAATTGTSSAFSRSTDGGVTWNQPSLIDVSAMGNLTLLDVVAADANTLYLLMWDNVNTAGTDFEVDDYSILFKSTDGGSSWLQIWNYRTPTGSTAGMTTLAPSPDYATDETLFVAQSDSRLWKSTNGGESFIGLTAPAAITAVGVVDKDTYYTGHAGAVYKSGRWTAATGVNDNVASFAIAADGTIFIGNDDGDVQVSTNDAGKFSTLGAGKGLGAANVIVVLDPNYASNNFIYAGSSDGAIGVNRWTYGTSSAWKQLDDDGDKLAVTGLVLSPDGSLYAASSTSYDSAVPEGSVRRSVGPQGPSAAAWDFETMGTDLTAGAKLDTLTYASGSNVLYAIASIVGVGSYGYAFRLFTITDNLAVSPGLSSPKDGTATPGTSVTFGWKGIDSPVSLTYEVVVSTDSKFAVSAGEATVSKSGTGVTITGFTAGTKYYWKVYATKPLSSKDSAVWTFTPKLTGTGTGSTTTSPSPGQTDVALRPTFQWSSVAGATSYELEFADNPFFANAQVKKPLTHTTWTWDYDLDYDTAYYWRVRAVKSGKGILTNYGPWSEASFTTMSKPAPAVAPTPPAVTVQPSPPIVIPPPVVQVPSAPPSPVTPAVIWAIIIIGAVLVIAVITLIVRTRRVP